MATAGRWGGQIYKIVMSHFSGFYLPKSLKSVNFRQSYSKNRKVHIFLGNSVEAITMNECMVSYCSNKLDWNRYNTQTEYKMSNEVHKALEN